MSLHCCEASDGLKTLCEQRADKKRDHEKHFGLTAKRSEALRQGAQKSMNTA